MEKYPNNCARNCWRSDLCQACDFFKSQEQANAEIREARRLFNKLKLKTC